MKYLKSINFHCMNAFFDYAKFSTRKRYKLKDVAEKIGASVGLVGNWNSKVATPSYDKLAKLIELGMTAQEMFGEELGDTLVKNSQPEQQASKGEILAAVKEALADLSKS